MTKYKNSLWRDFNVPLYEIERIWLRRFALTITIPVGIFAFILMEVVCGMFELRNDYGIRKIVR